jgi:hypothetical protein
MTRQEFIDIWQTSDSVAEAAKRCGIKKQTCKSRAGNYRRQGLPVKKFSRFSGTGMLSMYWLAAQAKADLNAKE